MTEMKLVAINIILKGMNAFPLVVYSCFVDDLSAEMTGPECHIKEELGGFILHVANSFCENDLELPTTKCVCSASTPALGNRLEKKWDALNTPYNKRSQVAWCWSW